MIPDGYRILVVYDSAKEKFVASVPELDNLKVTGETRAEALSKAEEEVENAFRKAAEESAELPPPVDGVEYSGEISAKISPSLHRNLIFVTAQEGIEIDQLVSELLSSALAERSLIKSVQRRPAREGHKREGRRDRRPRGDRYFNIMDDKASFIEYVRSLEPGGGGSGGRGHGGRGRGGRGRKG
jgi:predicted RNase H-like HicB family nuclease